MTAIFSTSDDLAADWVRLRDENAILAAQLAAVVAALDAYDVWPDDETPENSAAMACVSAIAEAVRR